MGITFKYSDPRGIEEPAALVALSSNVRYGDVALTLSAEVGDPALSTLVLDDTLAEYDFQGLRAFHVYETSAPSNNQMIGRFVIQDRSVTRGPSAITSNARRWSMDVTDYNWHLGKRIHVDADAKRPAETPGDRIRWLLNNAAHVNLNDYGNVTYPTSPVLEATDYRGQRPTDVLADCAIDGAGLTGYNYWVDFNEAHGRPELFFMDPDAYAYVSDVFISNHPYDADNVAIFAPSEDATLKRSPSRIAFGVYLAWANGSVYVRKDSTGEQFAKLDQTASITNIKSATRARRVATRFLNDNDEESDRITCSIIVPEARVNDVRHGQLVSARFTHFPGYEDWTAMRVVRRTVAQEAEVTQGYYRVYLDMVPSRATPPTPPYTGSAFGSLLNLSDIATAPNEEWLDIGDSGVPAGWFVEPNVGPITVSLGAALSSQTITVDQAMTVRVHARVNLNMVYFNSGSASMSVVSSVNGVIGTDSASGSTAGYNALPASEFVVNIPTYYAVAGEVFTIQLSRTGILAGGFQTIGNNAAGGAPDTTAGTFLRVGRGTQSWSSDNYTWVGP